MNICAIVLAAGEGKSMKTKHAKVALEAGGSPLIFWVKRLLDEIGAEDQAYIVGYRQEEVRAVLGEKVAYLIQEHQLGTGHAALQAEAFLIARSGYVLVMNGDTPLLTAETLRTAIKQVEAEKAAGLVITATATHKFGYGRIVRDENGEIERIIEEYAAQEEEIKIKEVNSGTYIFKVPLLLSALGKIAAENRHNRYDLSAAVEIMRQAGEKIITLERPFSEVFSVKTREDLNFASELLKQRTLDKHMNQGVTIVDPVTTYIGEEVEIGMDTIIKPNTYIYGKTTIGEDCVLGPDTMLTNATVKDSCQLHHAQISNSIIKERTKLGPYVSIHKNSIIGEDVNIGHFVEIKNSIIGADTIIHHQCYIGDADVGEGVNFGHGFGTANYDGLNKSRTIIEDHVFVGTNSCLVAPVKVGEYSYIAAGSTITENVEAYDLAIERGNLEIVEDWVLKRGKIKNKRINP